MRITTQTEPSYYADRMSAIDIKLIMAQIKLYIRSNCDEAALSVIKKNVHTLSKRNYISLILYMRRINTYLTRTIGYVWSKYPYIHNIGAGYTSREYKAFAKNDIFIEACTRSNIGLVKLLLADRAVDPNLHDGRAIEIACSKKDPDLLKILLDDGRCNPSRANNFATTLVLRDLKLSRYNVKRISNYIETLRLMLQDKRVDVRNNESLLADACTSGIIELVRILLEYGIDLGSHAGLAIRCAAKTKGNHEIIILLLQDERVDPTEYNNEALENAVMYGGISNVRALLSDDRVVSNKLQRSMDYTRAYKLDEIHVLLQNTYKLTRYWQQK